MTITGRPGILTAVRAPLDEELCVRLDRMKKLCDQLDAHRQDTEKYRLLLERIRREADAFRQTLTTHDPRI